MFGLGAGAVVRRRHRAAMESAMGALPGRAGQPDQSADPSLAYVVGPLLLPQLDPVPVQHDSGWFPDGRRPAPAMRPVAAPGISASDCVCRLRRLRDGPVPV